MDQAPSTTTTNSFIPLNWPGHPPASTLEAYRTTHAMKRHRSRKNGQRQTRLQNYITHGSEQPPLDSKMSLSLHLRMLQHHRQNTSTLYRNQGEHDLFLWPLPQIFCLQKIYSKVIISEALSTHVHLHGRTRPLHLRSRLWRLQWECPSTTASTVYLSRTTAFRLWLTCSRTVVSTWKQRTATLSRSKFRSIRSIPTWRRTQRVCLVGATCPLLFLLTRTTSSQTRKGYYWESTGLTWRVEVPSLLHYGGSLLLQLSHLQLFWAATRPWVQRRPIYFLGCEVSLQLDVFGFWPRGWWWYKDQAFEVHAHSRIPTWLFKGSTAMDCIFEEVQNQMWPIHSCCKEATYLVANCDKVSEEVYYKIEPRLRFQ